MSDLRSLCESKAEIDLLHSLEKWFRPPHLKCQVPVRRYRVDFMVGSTAIEMDGAEFHRDSQDKDDLRDAEILLSGEVSRIIRIPAAGFMFFREACHVALARWLDGISVGVRDHPDVLIGIEQIDRQADAFMKVEGDRDEASIKYYLEQDAVVFDGQYAHVGRPSAFLERLHPIKQYINLNDIKLYAWYASLQCKDPA